MRQSMQEDTWQHLHMRMLQGGEGRALGELVW